MEIWNPGRNTSPYNFAEPLQPAVILSIVDGNTLLARGYETAGLQDTAKLTLLFDIEEVYAVDLNNKKFREFVTNAGLTCGMVFDNKGRSNTCDKVTG